MSESFFKDDTAQEAGSTAPRSDTQGSSSAESTAKPVEHVYGSDEARMAAIMAYLPFLCFVPLLSMKDNKEVVFHARQGIMLFLIELAAALFLVDAVSDLVFKGILFSAGVLSIAGIVFAAKGRNYRLPVIGDLADKAKL